MGQTLGETRRVPSQCFGIIYNILFRRCTLVPLIMGIGSAPYSLEH